MGSLDLLKRHALMAGWLLLGVLASPAIADTVVMDNGLEMEGKVQVETEKFIIILVYNDTGRIRIPRSRIKRIEYDFDSKIEGLAEDDYQGHYDLGVWAFNKGKYKEAIVQFEKVKGKEAGKELMKLLGQAYDRRDQLDKAYEAYKAYLKFTPEAELQARMDEIAKQLGLGGTTTTGPAPVKIKEGLEDSFRWKSENGWENVNPCRVSKTVDKDTKNKMFVIQAGKGEFKKTVVSGVGAPLDLSKHSEIIFKFYHNSPRTLKVAVAFKNKKGDFYESQLIRVPGNSWTKSRISLTGSKFKSAQSNWEYKTQLNGRGHINDVILMIYTEKKFTMYVDHIFFNK